MWSLKQATLLYNAIRDCGIPNIRDDLPEVLEGSELWRAEDEPVINFYPYEIEGKEYYCLSGQTYGLWSLIKKEFDFEWKREIGGNDSHNAAIVLKSELDKDKFTAFCDEWGFLFNVCDEAETDDEAE